MSLPTVAGASGPPKFLVILSTHTMLFDPDRLPEISPFAISLIVTSMFMTMSPPAINLALRGWIALEVTVLPTVCAVLCVHFTGIVTNTGTTLDTGGWLGLFPVWTFTTPDIPKLGLAYHKLQVCRKKIWGLTKRHWLEHTKRFSIY